jgi:hypothetical protein
VDYSSKAKSFHIHYFSVSIGTVQYGGSRSKQFLFVIHCVDIGSYPHMHCIGAIWPWFFQNNYQKFSTWPPITVLILATRRYISWYYLWSVSNLSQIQQISNAHTNLENRFVHKYYLYSDYKWFWSYTFFFKGLKINIYSWSTGILTTQDHSIIINGLCNNSCRVGTVGTHAHTVSAGERSLTVLLSCINSIV